MRRIALIASLLVLLPALAFAQGTGPIVRSANMQVAATALGNGNVLYTDQAATAAIQYVGGSAVITIEASQDGTNWTILPCYPVGNATVASTFTASTTVGMARCNVAGIAVVRARISTYTSGSITVVGMATSLVSSGNAF